MRIAHIINPVKVDESRDLHWQQPITFETMKKASDFIHKPIIHTDGLPIFPVQVDQFATCYYKDEDIIPGYFKTVDSLEKSALDLQDFGIPRKLPLLREILQKLYDTSDADYFIYTNADIALMPHFYVLVKDLIDAGHDAFCINKRILDEKFKDESLSVMWSTMGEGHAGHDCFVFRRELFPLMNLGNIITGTPWSETTLIANLVMFAKNFKVFKNAHATFHLGDRRIWLPHTYNDYRIVNTNEFARILKKLSKRNKKILKHETIKYLLDKLNNEVTGYKDEIYSKDCWYFVDRQGGRLNRNLGRVRDK